MAGGQHVKRISESSFAGLSDLSSLPGSVSRSRTRLSVEISGLPAKVRSDNRDPFIETGRTFEDRVYTVNRQNIVSDRDRREEGVAKGQASPS